MMLDWLNNFPQFDMTNKSEIVKFCYKILINNNNNQAL